MVTMCEWGDLVNLVVCMPPELSYTGKPRWAVKGVDRCIAPLVQALNDAGILTANSCCGHGKTEGQIFLHDGRELIIRNTKMENQFKQASIHWYDSAFHAGWKNKSELELISASACMLMKSFGWLVSDSDHQVVIAQTVSETQADGILQIPKGAIIHMYVLASGDDDFPSEQEDTSDES